MRISEIALRFREWRTNRQESLPGVAVLRPYELKPSRGVVARLMAVFLLLARGAWYRSGR